MRPETTSDTPFEQYVLPEIEVLLRVAQSLTRNHAHAEDLVQETLLRAHRSIETFDGRYPRAWLLTILRNTHINLNRRRRPELLRDPDVAGAEHEPAPERTDAFVEDSFDAEVVAALDTLSDDQRMVVELVDIDGLSYAEAADVLDVPVGTVMSRLHRARTNVRNQLHDAGFTPRKRQQ